MRLKRSKNVICFLSIIILCVLCFLLLTFPGHFNRKSYRFQLNKYEKYWRPNIDQLKTLANRNMQMMDDLQKSLKEAIDKQIRVLNDQVTNRTRIPVMPILLISCNRKDAVQKSLNSLLKLKPNIRSHGRDIFPIFVSQDCGHAETKEAILKFSDNITFMENPDQSEIVLARREKKFKDYYKISRHYHWALNQIFNVYNYDFVIVVEDDLEISIDFYYYFLATHKLLLSDKSIWCISAWNDNGKANLVNANENSRLYRTDFFPGLGWMTTKSIWHELEPKWPKAYWDDWVRNPEQRKMRSCIRPEISRTKTFGKFGVSKGMYFEKHLKFIILNQKFVNFTAIDLTYLQKDKYDKSFLDAVNNAYNTTIEQISSVSLRSPEIKDLQVSYNDAKQFKLIALKFGLMDDFRAGVCRTCYFGILTMFHNNKRIYIRPNFNWTGYSTSWS